MAMSPPDFIGLSIPNSLLLLNSFSASPLSLPRLLLPRSKASNMTPPSATKNTPSPASKTVVSMSTKPFPEESTSPLPPPRTPPPLLLLFLLSIVEGDEVEVNVVVVADG